MKQPSQIFFELGGTKYPLAAWTPGHFRKPVGRIQMGRAPSSDTAPISTTHRPFEEHIPTLVPAELSRANGLADVLLAIEQRRGTLFMLDVSRLLIEKWNLAVDQLQAQGDETKRFVDAILKT